MTIGFGYLTYPSFNIAWDDHALPAILHRLLSASGRERENLMWWAAALAQQNGYGVRSGVVEEGSVPSAWVEIDLPSRTVTLWMEGGLFSDADQQAIKEFCAEQLKDLPKPPEDAMRYGQSPYETARDAILGSDPFETLRDRLSFRGEEV